MTRSSPSIKESINYIYIQYILLLLFFFFSSLKINPFLVAQNSHYSRKVFNETLVELYLKKIEKEKEGRQEQEHVFLYFCFIHLHCIPLKFDVGTKQTISFYSFHQFFRTRLKYSPLFKKFCFLFNNKNHSICFFLKVFSNPITVIDFPISYCHLPTLNSILEKH